ncbi:MAG TPA: PEP-CTERM sorting domain-containing protein [Terriglobales bacterium]|nr:PEP-CTERM sorting domain-containing protein [Terriglobales bacterium]
MRLVNSACVLLLVFGTYQAFADSIAVQNPSFEIPILSLGNAPGQNGDSTGTWISYAPGWPGSVTGGAGEYMPSPTSLPSGATDGNDVLWVNFGYVQQALNATLQSGATYNLQVDVAQRTDDTPINYYVYLMAGNTIVAADNSSLHPAPGTWLTSSLTYTAGANDPLAGQTLSIVLGVNTWQTDFDNVRLTETPATVPTNGPGVGVPEPASLALSGAGLLALALRRRRKSL